MATNNRQTQFPDFQSKKGLVLSSNDNSVNFSAYKECSKVVQGVYLKYFSLSSSVKFLYSKLMCPII